VFTRQSVPHLSHERMSAFAGVAHGGYILADVPNGVPQIILIGTGSEAQLAWQAQQRLTEEGIAARAVCLPSWELFAAQPQAYRDEVLPPDARLRVSVEAGVTQGWERYVGSQGASVGLDRFGASAPGALVMQNLGVTVENVLAHAKRLLASSR
jgi:transketolase